MGGCVGSENRRNRHVGSVASGVHGHQAAPFGIITNNHGDRTASLRPVDFFQEATATTAQQGDLARDFGGLLERLDIRVGFIIIIIIIIIIVVVVVLLRRLSAAAASRSRDSGIRLVKMAVGAVISRG